MYVSSLKGALKIPMTGIFQYVWVCLLFFSVVRKVRLANYNICKNNYLIFYSWIKFFSPVDLSWDDEIVTVWTCLALGFLQSFIVLRSFLQCVSNCKKKTLMRRKISGTQNKGSKSNDIFISLYTWSIEYIKIFFFFL